MLKVLRPGLARVLAPVGKTLARTPLTPNMVTVIGATGMTAGALAVRAAAWPAAPAWFELGVLIAANLAVFIHEVLLGAHLGTFVSEFAMVPAAVAAWMGAISAPARAAAPARAPRARRDALRPRRRPPRLRRRPSARLPVGRRVLPVATSLTSASAAARWVASWAARSALAAVIPGLREKKFSSHETSAVAR